MNGVGLLCSKARQWSKPLYGCYVRRQYHTTIYQNHELKTGGAGIGNVRDRMMTTSRLAFEELYKHTKKPSTVSMIGAPLTYGQPFVGTDISPALLRQSGIASMLGSLGWRVEDLGDIDFASIADSVISSGLPTIPSAHNCAIVGTCNEHLSKVTEDVLRKGRFPLIMGGDHAIGCGSLAGILRAQPNTGVLWIDAHADLNIPSVSESGNMHGMSLGLLMEGVAPNHSELPGHDWLLDGPRLAPDSIVYIGLRDVDAFERNAIRELDILAFTMHDIDHYGIGEVMDIALKHLTEKDPDRPLHMSYDIDAVDPLVAPATGTRVRGGLTYREAHYVSESVAKCANLASAEIVELNPTLSDDEGAKDTIDLGLQLITSMLGKSII